jgi:hypothetical protein
MVRCAIHVSLENERLLRAAVADVPRCDRQTVVLPLAGGGSWSLVVTKM